MSLKFEEIFTKAAIELKKPAGDSPLYSSLEKIQQNIKTFIPIVHDTWRKWHYKALGEILKFDYAFEADKKKPIGDPFREWTHYMRQIWRKVNDSIVWGMTGESRHFIKRLCLYRKRGLLTEANPNSIIECLDYLYKDPFSMAIWNDATTCIDIGDISLLRHNVGQWYFLEVKKGKVNEEISELTKTKDQEQFNKQMDLFVSKYGKKGFKQVERCYKQSEVSSMALNLLNKEKGIDPVSSRYTEVKELKTLDEFYDGVFNDFLSDVYTKRKDDILLVDNCLWIYVNCIEGENRVTAVSKFSEFLNKNDQFYRENNKARLPSYDMGGLVNLNQSFDIPMARPIFLRRFDPIYIGELSIGNLMNRVLMFLDFDRFGELMSAEGAEFSWSSRKDAKRLWASPRKDRLSVIYYGRIPQYTRDDFIGQFTEHSLTRILFDGIRPQTIAKQLVESIQYMKEMSERLQDENI